MDLSIASVPELTRACAESGNEEAWEEFIGRFQECISAMVVKACRRWGATDSQTVDDLIQEVYVRVCANRCRVLRDFDERHPDSIYGLLKSVAYSVVQDHFRAASAKKRDWGRMANDQGFGQRESNVEREILIGEIDSALQDANPRDRDIFWLYYRQGLSARAIAQIPFVSLTPKGVEAALFRLTQQLRKKFLGNMEPPSEGKARRAAF